MLEVSDYHDQLARLNRVRGQLDGLSRMIEQQRPANDLLIQLRAARSALRAIESNVVKRRIEQVLGIPGFAGHSQDAAAQVDELLGLIERFTR